MGQPQSKQKPVPPVRKHKKSLKVPSDWKNNADFQVVSPVSDISNPSQFRGRAHTNQITTTVRRNRTSKVYPKSRPPTGLPPPQRFYFHGLDEPEQPPTGMRLFQAKCAKVKKMIGECLFQPPEEQRQHQVIPEIKHHQGSPKIPKTIQEVPTQHDPYLQFDPNWKGSKGYMPGTDSNPFLEDDNSDPSPEIKAAKLFAAAESIETSYAPVPSVTQTHSSSGISAARGRLLSLESSAVTDSTSKAPSVLERVQTFEKQSLKMPRSQSAPKQHSIQQIMQQKTTDDIFRRHPNQNVFRNTNYSKKKGSSMQHADRKAIVLAYSDVTMKNRPRHVDPPLRERAATTDDSRPIRRSDSSRQRASIVPSFSNDSDDTRRSSIQEQLQRQIDAQRFDKYSTIDERPLPIKTKTSFNINHDTRYSTSTKSNNKKLNRRSKSSSKEERLGFSSSSSSSSSSVSSSSRVERLRKQHKREMKRLSAQVDKYQVPKSRSMDDGYFTTTKKVFPEIQRSNSVPARATQAHQRNNRPSTARMSLTSDRRSSSVPRASVEGSALLKLTGWKENNNNKRTSQEVPALLKIAGWKDRPKKDATKVSKAIVPFVKQAVPKLTDRAFVQKTEPAPQTRKVVTKKQVVAYHKKEQQQKPHCRSSVSTDAITAALPISKPDSPHRETTKLVHETSTGSNTIAKILQQAYFEEEEGRYAAKFDQPNTTSDFRIVSLPPQSPYVKPGHTEHESMMMSPAMSTATNGTMPMVSDQANENSEFLFDTESNVIRRQSIQSSQAHVTISTLDSQNRMIAKTDQPVYIPLPSSNSSYVSGASSQNSRRVHFSNKVEEVGPVAREVELPMGIESKLSDLTESTSSTVMSHLRPSAHHSARDSASSATFSIQRIDSIPEEDEGESPMSKMSERLVGEEDFSEDAKEHENEEEEDITPKNPPMMRWSVRNDNGVTPVLGGRATKMRETTNSPYLRFKQAKSLFAPKSGVVAIEQELVEKPPVKKFSGSLVTSRVAAMEGRRVRSEGGATTKILANKKPHRATTGSTAIAPRKGSLISPALARINSTKKGLEGLEKENSSTLSSDNQTSNSIPSSVHEKSPQWSIASVVSADDEDNYSSDDDVFGKILHPTTIDEDSESEMNYTSEEESTLQPSVSTVCNRYSVASSVASGSVSTILQPRRVNQMHQQQQQENKIPSAIDRLNRLPFTQAAPVKPTGSPMPARSWRVLAAAARPNVGQSYQ